MEWPRIDGHTPGPFGRLTFVSVERRSSDNRIMWRMSCSCGGTALVSPNKAMSGHTRSCGCLYRESRRAGKKYGDLAKQHKAEYTIWRGLKARCTDPNHRAYPDYGGRGIAVWSEWEKDFSSFLSHIGPRPSHRHQIDRIDNNAGYVPGNVRWATKTTQARNTRANRFIEARGQRRTIAEWAEISGLTQGRIKDRIRHGWDCEAAIFTPINPNLGRRR
jgi:hypothetical protein